MLDYTFFDLICEGAYKASSQNCCAFRRDALIQGCEPCIDYDVLNSAHIYLLGKELKFNDLNQVA